MFTGLVEEIGIIEKIENIGQGLRIHIRSKVVIKDLALGDSIAINGICLTAVNYSNDVFSVEAVGETLERSNLSYIKVGSPVNLERAVRADTRLGGHFVQGHVDGIGRITALESRDPGLWLTIHVSDELTPLMVEKGSICIDGVSLTIAKIKDTLVSIAIIPFTANSTTLKQKKTGDNVNIEVDILGKYINKLIQPYQNTGRISWNKLDEWGF